MGWILKLARILLVSPDDSRQLAHTIYRNKTLNLGLIRPDDGVSARCETSMFAFPAFSSIRSEMLELRC